MTPAEKTATEMPGRRPSERLLATLGGVHVSVDVAPGQRLATADVIEVCQALADATAELALVKQERDAWKKAAKRAKDVFGSGNSKGRPMDIVSNKEWSWLEEAYAVADMFSASKLAQAQETPK